MIKRRLLLIFLFCLIADSLLSQGDGQRFRVMFYNVENLFDPFNDSITNDEEFTPQGVRHWTWDKMNKKLSGIYKIVMAVGEWDPPVLVGLCEVENGFVLHRLVTETPISKFEYHIIHRDSPDPRGIDVALLYRPDKFNVQETHFFKVEFPDEPNRKTREILYARGTIGEIDTLHVFVNHWPSKYGGELESEPGRFAAANTLKSKVDSIKVFYPNAHILIMGDFNDEPESEPITNRLMACQNLKSGCNSGLVNISAILKSNGQGSYKYQGVWGMIDQLIVSTSLLGKNGKIFTSPDYASVFKASFLLEKDEGFVGEKPFRTFAGYKFNGGFSDHLPVYIDLIINSEN